MDGRVAAPIDRRSRAGDVLALHGGVLTEMRDRRLRPARWSVPAFAREVDQILEHLAAIRSRELLVESFGRESSYLLATRHLSVADAEHILATSAVDVAYAMRLVELAEGSGGARWASWIGKPATRLTRIDPGDVGVGSA